MRTALALGLGWLFAAAAGADGPAPFVGGSPVAADPVRDLTPDHIPEPPKHASACPPGEPGGLYGQAELLLWRPRRNALDFAVNDPLRDLNPTGNLESLNYEFRPGLRAGLGYRLPGTAWEIGTTYTYFRSDDSRSVNAPPAGNLYPTLTRPGIIDAVTSASARAGLEYNIFDLESGRRWDVDDTLRLRAYGGLRFASIRQSLDVTYDGGDADLATTSTRVQFQGVGPHVGGEGWMMLTPKLGLFGRVGAGLVSGELKTPLRALDHAGATVHADLDIRTRRVIPVLSVALGAEWEYRGLRVGAGYELTNWFGLVERASLVDDFSEGRFNLQRSDLALEGVFLRAGFHY